MLDLLFKGGIVVDGTGGAPFVADVGVRGDRIVAVGALTEAALETVDARGLWVTPGFVDIHTHYDGQVTWDDNFTPSIYHGVTIWSWAIVAWVLRLCDPATRTT